jgi:hypothetical protein
MKLTDETPIPEEGNPVPDEQAMELENLPLPAEMKPWFQQVLTFYGFAHIAVKVAEDESDTWFSNLFCGLTQGLAEATGMLQQVMGAQMVGPAGKEPGVAVVEQDKRLVLPGDPEYQS